VALVRIRVSHVTLPIVVITLRILGTAAHMAVACRVGVWTVGTAKTIVSTTWFTFSIVTIVTEVAVMRSRNVANTVDVFTVGISATLGVGAGSIRSTLSVTLLRAVRIRAAGRHGAGEVLCTCSTVTTVSISTAVSRVQALSVRSTLAVTLLRAVLVSTTPVIVTLPVFIAHSVTALCALIIGAARGVEAGHDSVIHQLALPALVLVAVAVLRTTWLVMAVARVHTGATQMIVFTCRVVTRRAPLAIVTVNGVGPVTHRAIGVLDGGVKS